MLELFGLQWKRNESVHFLEKETKEVMCCGMHAKKQ